MANPTVAGRTESVNPVVEQAMLRRAIRTLLYAIGPEPYRSAELCKAVERAKETLRETAS